MVPAWLSNLSWWLKTIDFILDKDLDFSILDWFLISCLYDEVKIPLSCTVVYCMYFMVFGFVDSIK